MSWKKERENEEIKKKTKGCDRLSKSESFTKKIRVRETKATGGGRYVEQGEERQRGGRKG